LDANTVSSMLEVRAAIDALDVQIVTLLGTRLRFIEAASRIKPVKEAVRDEPRKRDVLDKAMATAEKVNFPPKLMEDIYEVLVEGCINYEGVKFDEREAAKENGEQ
ncbi:putative chorismate mutase, partial [Ascobolus immersus RN42]